MASPDLSDKRFAVIIDEAHSSQSGTAYDNMNRSMDNTDDDADADADAVTIRALISIKTIIVC
jgi:type I restriction enzyme R subunit